MLAQGSLCYINRIILMIMQTHLGMRMPKGGFALGLKPLEDVQGAKLLQDPGIAVLLYQAPIKVKDNQISS